MVFVLSTYSLGLIPLILLMLRSLYTALLLLNFPKDMAAALVTSPAIKIIQVAGRSAYRNTSWA